VAAVTFEVVFAGCAGCGACLLTCPKHAIRPVGGELHARRDLCTGCGECVEVCPADAIQINATEPAAGKPAAGKPAAGKPVEEKTVTQTEEWPR
jgi:ferredoxin